MSSAAKSKAAPSDEAASSEGSESESDHAENEAAEAEDDDDNDDEDDDETSEQQQQELVELREKLKNALLGQKKLAEACKGFADQLKTAKREAKTATAKVDALKVTAKAEESTRKDLQSRIRTLQKNLEDQAKSHEEETKLHQQELEKVLADRAANLSSDSVPENNISTTGQTSSTTMMVTVGSGISNPSRSSPQIAQIMGLINTAIDSPWIALWKLRAQVELSLTKNAGPGESAAQQLAYASAQTAYCICLAELGTDKGRKLVASAVHKAQFSATKLLLRFAPTFASSDLAAATWTSLILMLAKPDRLRLKFRVVVLRSLRASIEAAWDNGVRGRDLQGWARMVGLLSDRISQRRLCRRLQFAAIQRKDWRTYGVLLKASPLDNTNVLDETIVFLRSRAARQPSAAGSDMTQLVRDQQRLHETLTSFLTEKTPLSTTNEEQKRKIGKKSVQLDMILALEFLATHMGAPWVLEHVVRSLLLPHVFDEVIGPAIIHVISEICKMYAFHCRALVAAIVNQTRDAFEAAPPQNNQIEELMKVFWETLNNELRTPTPPTMPDPNDHVILSIHDVQNDDDDDFVRANSSHSTPNGKLNGNSTLHQHHDIAITRPSIVAPRSTPRTNKRPAPDSSRGPAGSTKRPTRTQRRVSFATEPSPTISPTPPHPQPVETSVLGPPKTNSSGTVLVSSSSSSSSSSLSSSSSSTQEAMIAAPLSPRIASASPPPPSPSRPNMDLTAPVDAPGPVISSSRVSSPPASCSTPVSTTSHSSVADDENEENAEDSISSITSTDPSLNIAVEHPPKSSTNRYQPADSGSVPDKPTEQSTSSTIESLPIAPQHAQSDSTNLTSAAEPLSPNSAPSKVTNLKNPKAPRTNRHDGPNMNSESDSESDDDPELFMEMLKPTSSTTQTGTSNSKETYEGKSSESVPNRENAHADMPGSPARASSNPEDPPGTEEF